jgi:hypothetical protein
MPLQTRSFPAARRRAKPLADAAELWKHVVKQLNYNDFKMSLKRDVTSALKFSAGFDAAWRMAWSRCG